MWEATIDVLTDAVYSLGGQALRKINCAGEALELGGALVPHWTRAEICFWGSKRANAGRSRLLQWREVEVELSPETKLSDRCWCA